MASQRSKLVFLWPSSWPVLIASPLTSPTDRVRPTKPAAVIGRVATYHAAVITMT